VAGTSVNATIRSSQDKDQTQLKELEEKKMKRKMWLKASQNVLFFCPCCQGHCLNEDNAPDKKTFSVNSICNFKYKLDHHPKSFVRKELYVYLKNR
jgi:hypothetical protein